MTQTPASVREPTCGDDAEPVRVRMSTRRHGVGGPPGGDRSCRGCTSRGLETVPDRPAPVWEDVYSPSAGEAESSGGAWCYATMAKRVPRCANSPIGCSPTPCGASRPQSRRRAPPCDVFARLRPQLSVDPQASAWMVSLTAVDVRASPPLLVDVRDGVERLAAGVN